MRRQLEETLHEEVRGDSRSVFNRLEAAYRELLLLLVSRLPEDVSDHFPETDQIRNKKVWLFLYKLRAEKLEEATLKSLTPQGLMELSHQCILEN